MDKIHITCNIDENYIQHCAVTLTSLFVNNRDQIFEVHIIADQLPKQAIEILQDVANQYNQTLFFYLGHSELLKNCTVKSDSHISIATYYRCFLTEFLPSNIQKTIYLDCDLIVRHSIANLWNTNMDGYSVACVEDMWSNRSGNYDRLHYSHNYSYFNAGVLLINLEYWREHHTSKNALRYIEENAKNLLFYDQDVLNKLFYASKLFLPATWNMQDGFFRKKRWIRTETAKEVDQFIHDPAIIHYTGSKKPWHDKSEHPFKSEYYRYLDLTPLKGWRPKTNYRHCAVRLINSLLYSLRILKPKYIKINVRKKI